MTENITEFVGHHGTDRSSSERIEKTNFKPNNQSVGWLGTGVYFFENNLDLAKEFANKIHRGPTKIFESILKIPTNVVFDTTIPKNQEIFHTYRNELKNMLYKKGNMDVVSRNREDFDGKVYNLIARREKFELIRAQTFTPPADDKGIGAQFSRVPNGTELCLRNIDYVNTKYIVDS